MSIREQLDISAYLVIGPENCTQPVEEIVWAAVKEGFTCIQIRSKIATAREMISILEKSARAINELGKSDSVALLVDDRLDVVLAAREAGIKVDGIHVGQSDIPVEVCRKYLGEDSVVGLSARTEELIDYVKNIDVSQIDYFGAGPLHKTQTKLDAGKTSDGKFITHDFNEISELVKISPRPIVVGGGVKLKDIPDLAATKVQGFFVVSAVAGAENPRLAARELVTAWKNKKLAAKFEKLQNKMLRGEKLKPEEKSFLREHYPELAAKADQMEQEAEQFKKRLQGVKSKEDAQKIYLETKMNVMSELNDKDGSTIFLSAAIDKSFDEHMGRKNSPKKATDIFA